MCFDWPINNLWIILHLSPFLSQHQSTLWPAFAVYAVLALRKVTLTCTEQQSFIACFHDSYFWKYELSNEADALMRQLGLSVS